MSVPPPDSVEDLARKIQEMEFKIEATVPATREAVRICREMLEKFRLEERRMKAWNRSMLIALAALTIWMMTHAHG